MKNFAIVKSGFIFIMSVFLLTPMIVGCQNEEPTNEVKKLDDLYTFIVGEWDWEKTIIPARPGILVKSPETEGLTKQFIFQSDRILRILENEIVVQSSEYRFEASENSFELLFIETGSRMVLSFKADTLILSNPAFGDASYYIRN
ncbi:hypothetical protein [Algoriphagus sp.]|uniref:hypothetical protein n=1 Tax=Algoriphagus sp. TaxID=1872435 RepID=UPI00391AFC22